MFIKLHSPVFNFLYTYVVIIVVVVVIIIIIIIVIIMSCKVLGVVPALYLSM